MKFGVVVFPGSNCDHDTFHVLGNVLGQSTVEIWHEQTEIPAVDAIVIPGGFSYGDYLRCGAIAGHAHVMPAVKKFAQEGGPVIGICNGFQVLCETGLLPGALLRNKRIKFLGRTVNMRVETANTPFTGVCEKGQVLKDIPIAHGDGDYFAEEETLRKLEENDQIVFRYSTAGGEVVNGAETNPNGSIRNIAGICNRERNVLGLMPHPERASESQMGSSDGLVVFQSMLQALIAT